MKKIIILLISVFVLAGCENKHNDSEPQTKLAKNDTSMSSISDSTITAVADSMSMLKAEMDSLKEQVQSLINKIDTQETSIGELKVSKANKYFGFMVGIPALLVIILIITIYKFGNSFSKTKDVRNYVSSLHQRTKDLEARLNQVINETNNALRNINRGRHAASIDYGVSAQIKDLESRVQALEKVMTQEKSPSLNSTTNTSTVYFGNLKAGNDFSYFDDKYNTCKDEAKFKVFLNGDYGTFELFDIRRVLSSDANKKAITYSKGSVAISEANGFQPMNAGKVHLEKRNGHDIWIMDKPVEIKLTK